MKTITKKAIYYCDAWSSDLENESDVRIIEREFYKNGYVFNKKINITNLPPFDKTFQILFFDYGGMIAGAGDTVYSLCKQLINDANKNPQKDYIITSKFSVFLRYMDEAKKEIGTDHNNVYFSLEDYLYYLTNDL